MTTDRSGDLMQAVLDDTATSAEAAELRATIARGGAAADEFASWQALFDGLSTLPAAHPPEGLVATITTAVASAPLGRRDAARGVFADDDQLSGPTSVFGAGSTRTTRRPFGFKTVSSWLMPAPSKESLQMNTQRKYLAVGAAAVVALGIAAVLSNYPPKSNDVVGTVVPAERYRAPQSGAEAVKLGEQGTPSTAVTTAGESVPAASNVEAAAQADKADAQMQADHMVQSQATKADAQMQADHMVQSQATKADAQMQADRMVQSQATKADAQMQADRVVQSQANKADAQMQADHASVQRQANQADAAARADLASAQKQADRAATAQAQANKADAAARADLAAAQKQADRASSLQKMADKAAPGADNAARQ